MIIKPSGNEAVTVDVEALQSAVSDLAEAVAAIPTVDNSDAIETIKSDVELIPTVDVSSDVATIKGDVADIKAVVVT